MKLKQKKNKKYLLQHIYQSKIIYKKKLWRAKIPSSLFNSYSVDGQFYHLMENGTTSVYLGKTTGALWNFTQTVLYLAKTVRFSLVKWLSQEDRSCWLLDGILQETDSTECWQTSMFGTTCFPLQKSRRCQNRASQGRGTYISGLISFMALKGKLEFLSHLLANQWPPNFKFTNTSRGFQFFVLHVCSDMPFET